MSKKLIYLVSFVLLLSMASTASAGLVAHWKLDEGSGTTAYDSSGQGNDGTLIGDPQWVAGLLDGALEFDGIGDYVDFGNPPDLPAGRSARSMCGWGKTNTIAGGWRWIAAYGSAATSQSMFIGITGDDLFGGGYGDDIQNNDFWEVGVWRHICLTYDGTTARLYADGIEVASGAKNWNLVLNRAHIGRQVNDVAEFWDGAVDDVRIYNRSLSAAQVQDLFNGISPTWLKAEKPYPADGAMFMDTWVNLAWSPGDSAVSHDVYLGKNFDDVNDGTADTFRGNQDLNTTTLFVGFIGYPYPDGLVPGTTYYWRIDEIEADGTTIHKGNVWSFMVPPKTAYNPDPADGAKFVGPNADLNWMAGFGAVVHYVYFGDNFDDVNSADGALYQTDTTYSPAGPLEIDKTYYWRVDESVDTVTMLKGDVWSFKTLPVIPISDPNLVGWWKLDEDSTTAVDWSGHDNHGALRGDPQWVPGYDGGALEFDGSDDYVDFGNPSDWPSGTSARSMCGWARTDTVSAGYAWIAAYGSPATSQAMFIGLLNDDLVGGGYGGDDVFMDDFWQVGVWHHICLTYDGTTARMYTDGINVASEAKDWNLALSRAHIGRQVNDASEFWDGLVDDVRIYNKTLTQDEVKEIMRGDTSLAWDPKPANKSTPYIKDVTPLSWSPGDKASQHDVYFGIDRDTVADANASDTTGVYRGRQFGTSYTPPDVEWGGGPYYWRIDENNTDATISEGKIWSFTVADFIVIDDFEDYNDFEPDRIFDVWMDGWGVDTNGAEVGYANPDFLAGEHHVETTIVHGGRQSMPYLYENNFKYSEAVYSPTQRDWTEEGVGVLSLWFYGDTANAAERMYVALNSGTAVYHDNANAAQIDEWTEWTIDLQAFTGVGLTNVNRIAIGFGDKNNLQAGGSGWVFFDDIRLYRLAEPQP